MNTLTKRTFLTSSLAALSTPLFAQTAYPNRPITLIVPYAPAGATDIIGRVVAEELSRSLGHSVVVENRAGAGGSVGATAASKAAADGYTLMLGALSSHSINTSLQSKLGFDLKKDFAPISIAGIVGLAMVVHPSVEAKTVQEFIALAKAKPADFPFASAGVGSPQHLAGEMFNIQTGLKLTHLPYRGSGPMMNDMLGGHVKLMFDTVASILPHVQAGSVRALATTGNAPSQFMPTIPIMQKEGLPNFEVNAMFGLLAPTGTPPEIITKLNQEMIKALKTEKVLASFKLQGVEPHPTTPVETANLIDKEIIKWANVIKSAGIKQME